MKEERTHRPILLRDWQMERLESWLAAMARKGWMLEKLGIWMARFRRCEPADVRFRCEPAVSGRIGLGEQRAIYRSGGWQYVDSWRYIVVYCSTGNAASEVHTDGYEHSLAIQVPTVEFFPLQVLLLVIVLGALSIVFVTSLDNAYSIRKMLLDPNPIFLMFFIILYGNLGGFCMSLRRRRLAGKLRQGREYAHKKTYQLARVFNTMLSMLLVVLIALALGLPAYSLVRMASGADNMPVPKGDLAVVSASDFTGMRSFTRCVELGYSNQNNNYSQSWSLLVPEQYVLNESIVLMDGSSDMDGEANLRLRSEQYKALTEPIAGLLAEMIARSPDTEKQPYDDWWLPFAESPNFDKLWIYDSANGNDHEIVALRDCFVFHIVVSSTLEMNDILGLLEKKAANTENLN